MNLSGVKTQFAVLVRGFYHKHKQGDTDIGKYQNTAEEFTWRGDLLYVFSGVHTFRFEPSKTTPGHTRFVNCEEFARFNTIFMRLMPASKIFYQFCEQLKQGLGTPRTILPQQGGTTLDSRGF